MIVRWYVGVRFARLNLYELATLRNETVVDVAVFNLKDKLVRFFDYKEILSRPQNIG